MSESQAFLAQILADRDNDLPRLVYADWLEEQGDPRGEFIKLQCEVDSLPNYHPRAVELEGRIQDLQSAHGDTWRAELQKQFSGLKQIDFRRGFPADVTLLSKRFLEAGEQLVNLTPLMRVKLHSGKELIPKVGSQAFMTQIRELDLNSLKIGAARTSEFLQSAHLNQLRWLDLSNNGLGQRGLQSLAETPNLSSLEELRLNHTKLTVSGLAELFQSTHYPALRRLSIQDRSRDLNDQVLQSLAKSPMLPQLTHLNLTGNAYTETGIVTLLKSQGMKGTTSLDLISPPFTNNCVAALAESPCLETLSELSLANRAMTSDEYADFQRLPSLPALRSLNLSHSPMSHADLPEAAWAGGLYELKLADCKLDDEVGARLFASPHMEQLCSLSVWHNQLGDRAMKSLAASPALGRMAMLNLAMNKITASGVAALLNSPHWKFVHTLLLGHNDYRQDILPLLRESPNLNTVREMSLSGNHLLPDDLEKLIRSPYAANLEFLNLWSLVVDDACARALLDHPKMKTVCIYNPNKQISAPVLRELTKRFGNLGLREAGTGR